MPDTPVQLLFVSRRGNARALMAQACLNHLAHGRLRAFSCGVPQGEAVLPHPLALATLTRAHFPTDGLECRDWRDFLQMRSPRMDFVITLDRSVAAQEPAWPGQPEVVLWHYDDLLAQPAPPETLTRAFVLLLHSLRRRLEIVANLPMSRGDRAALRSDLRDIAYAA